MRFRKRTREGIILLVCFLASFFLNLAGVLSDHAPAAEVVTRIHEILMLALVVYGSVLVLRVLYSLISRFWFRR